MEDRRYVSDVLDRAEMLAVTYSRLKALSDLFLEAEARIAPRVSNEDRKMPDEIVWQRDYWALEACVLVSFVYYELTSLSHMLIDNLKLPIPQGGWQYLIKARDKFLAHPMFRDPARNKSGGLTRNAHRTISITVGGLLHPYAVSADEIDPVLLDHYCAAVAAMSTVDQVTLRGENETLILSGTRNNHFSEVEKLRLKAFGIQEPDLGACPSNRQVRGYEWNRTGT